MIGASDVTTICSVAVDTLRTAFALTTSLPLSTIPVISAVVMPALATLTLYVPDGRPKSWYSPRELVFASRVAPVPTSRTVTPAFTTTAPLESVTVPRMVPRSVPWPWTKTLPQARRAKITRMTREGRGFISSSGVGLEFGNSDLYHRKETIRKQKKRKHNSIGNQSQEWHCWRKA